MTDVSIIVPVYQVEEYLEECLESLLNQTFQNYEIVLVDDGSSDSSPSICDMFAAKYNNVFVIHKENGGLSSARNAGMKIANGQFLLFCDSDDKLKPDALAQLFNCAKNTGSDLVISGYETFPTSKIVFPNVISGVCITPDQYISSCINLHSGNELCFSWRFFVSKKLILEKNIWFNESIRFGEDVIFNICVIMESRRLFVLSESYYYYRVDNSNSIMSKYKPLLTKWVNDQYVEKKKLTCKYGLDSYKGWKEDMSYYYVTRFQSMMLRNAMQSPKEKVKKELEEILSSPALQENYKYSVIFKDGLKHGVFCLLCKWKMVELVYLFSKKWFR